MSNPFLTPFTPAARLEKLRRERFRIGVYTSLAGLGIFLVTMLFQGCQRTDAPADPVAAPAPQDGVSNALVVFQPGPTPETVTVSNAAPAAPAITNDAPATSTGTAVPAIPAKASSGSEPAKERLHSAASRPATYTVKPGDTLTQIARTHHTTVAAIRAANSLKTDRILVGSRLTLPAAR